jgi:hypothetical protein
MAIKPTIALVEEGWQGGGGKGWTGLQDIYPCSANYVPSMSDQFEGSCLCGAVRFVATGQPKGISGLVTKTG